MPELPEVETLRRDITRPLSQKQIATVKVFVPKMTQPLGIEFSRRLEGKKITAVERRGKILVFVLSDTSRLHVHLKMTGQLVLKHNNTIVYGGHPVALLSRVPNKHTRIFFSFTNGDQLFFNDQRQFGYCKLLSKEESAKALATLAHEPTSQLFTFAYFCKQVQLHQQASIKSILLNQQVIAGVGNIYADESLWRARILPDRKINSFTTEELSILWQAVCRIMQLAVRLRGTSKNFYVTTDKKTGGFWKEIKVYGRGGQPCKRCGTILVKKKIAGRGTVFCTICQI